MTIHSVLVIELHFLCFNVAPLHIDDSSSKIRHNNHILLHPYTQADFFVWVSDSAFDIHQTKAAYDYLKVIIDLSNIVLESISSSISLLPLISLIGILIHLLPYHHNAYLTTKRMVLSREQVKVIAFLYPVLIAVITSCWIYYSRLYYLIDMFQPLFLHLSLSLHISSLMDIWLSSVKMC